MANRTYDDKQSRADSPSEDFGYHRSDSQKYRDQEYFKGRSKRDRDAFSTEGMPLLAEVRAKERDEATREKHRRRFKRVCIASISILVTLVAAFVIYNSSLFTISSLKVTGNVHLTDEDLSALAGVTASDTLLRIKTAEVEKRLEASPWIETATVSRDWPNALAVDITERTVMVYVEVPLTNLYASRSTDLSADDVTSKDSGENKAKVQIETWGITKDGIWLEKFEGDTTDHQHITEIQSDVIPESGKVCTDEGITNVLEIVGALSKDFLGQVATFEAMSAEKTILYLDSGVKIAFGSSEDTKSKEAIVTELLKEHKDKISYINVRVVDSPAWRGLEDAEE